MRGGAAAVAAGDAPSTAAGAQLGARCSYCHARWRTSAQAEGDPPQTVASPRLHTAPCFASLPTQSSQPPRTPPPPHARTSTPSSSSSSSSAAPGTASVHPPPHGGGDPNQPRRASLIPLSTAAPPSNPPTTGLRPPRAFPATLFPPPFTRSRNRQTLICKRLTLKVKTRDDHPRSPVPP